MNFKKKALVWFLTVSVFVAMDFLWLWGLTVSSYSPKLNDLSKLRQQLVASLTFAELTSVVMASGIVLILFRILEAKKSFNSCVLYGAFFGFLIHATYNLTNLWLIKGWFAGLAFADVGWGTFQGLLAGFNVAWLSKKFGLLKQV